MQWLLDNPWAIWLALAVLFAIVEMFSLELVLLMFAIGMACASVVAALGAPVFVAIGVFAVVSALLLALLRPRLVARLHSGPTLRQGPQRLVGNTGVVLSAVDSRDGRITIAGETWSARSEQAQQHFTTGDEVVVIRIDGATAIVAAARPSPQEA